MSIIMNRQLCRRLLMLMLIFCLVIPNITMAEHIKNEISESADDNLFSVLILGDSQMAGAGWDGGYANCILETYPNARILNLAQNGSELAKGDIHAQLEFYLTEEFPKVDLVLFDGGVNDLPYIQNEETTESNLELVRDSLCSLIEKIHETNPDAKMIYVLMPPLVEWGKSNSGPPAYDIQKRYWRYLNIIASTYEYVTVLDLFSLNPFHYPCVECYKQNFADSIHLNEAGYRKTFEYIDNIMLALWAEKMDDR